MKDKNYDIISNFERDNWWYKAKRNLFFLLLKKINGCEKKFESALDLGCGVGSNFEVLNRFAKNVTGIDSSDNAIRYCKNKEYDKLMKMDALKMKFKKDSFDIVLCSDVLEHIDDKKAVGEISRILKPRGLVIFSVPAHRYLWGPTDAMSNHLRRYEKKELLMLFLRDFDILKMGYWNFTAFFPNFVLTKTLSILKKGEKPKNTLEFIPKSLNKMLYNIMLIENKLFPSTQFPQGVSIVGVCRKK